MQIQDIKRLADLARINLTDDEMASIAKDIGPVLDYVDQLKSLDISGSQTSIVKNVIRSDDVKNESGSFTESILREAPDTEKGYIKVKKVL